MKEIWLRSSLIPPQLAGEGDHLRSRWWWGFFDDANAVRIIEAGSN
jgi:hypothetical protein